MHRKIDRLPTRARNRGTHDPPSPTRTRVRRTPTRVRRTPILSHYRGRSGVFRPRPVGSASYAAFFQGGVSTRTSCHATGDIGAPASTRCLQASRSRQRKGFTAAQSSNRRPPNLAAAQNVGCFESPPPPPSRSQWSRSRCPCRQWVFPGAATPPSEFRRSSRQAGSNLPIPRRQPSARTHSSATGAYGNPGPDKPGRSKSQPPRVWSAKPPLGRTLPASRGPLRRGASRRRQRSYPGRISRERPRRAVGAAFFQGT